MLVHEAKCMAEFVQNDAFLRFGNRVRCTNPTQVHRGLVGVDEADFVPDVGPRARARIKTDANGGVAVGDKGELDISILHPFLDDSIDFFLLNGVPTNEGVVEFLFL